MNNTYKLLNITDISDYYKKRALECLKKLKSLKDNSVRYEMF